MKKILFLSIVIALSLSGCFKGQGDVKIKAAVNFLGIEKVIPDLEIYIDNKKMGVTQAGFVTYKIDEGSHTVTLKELDKEFLYDKVYSKTISITPDSTTELIFDLTKKPKIEVYKSRKENLAKLFKKYNLVGEWRSSYFYFHGKNMFLSLKIKNNGEWEAIPNGKYKNKSNLNSLITDTGKNLLLKVPLKNSKNVPLNFKYPKIKDGCFYFTPIGDYTWFGQGELKFCTQKKIKYEYVKDVIIHGSDRGIMGEIYASPMLDRNYLINTENGTLITDNEIKIVANYVANGMRGKGKKLFENTCGYCHGNDGKGSSMDPDITHLTYFPKRHISYKELTSGKYKFTKKAGYYIDLPKGYKGNPFEITSNKKMFMNFGHEGEYLTLNISSELANELSKYADYLPYIKDSMYLLVKPKDISQNIINNYAYQLPLKKGEKFYCSGIKSGEFCLATKLSDLFVENK